MRIIAAISSCFVPEPPFWLAWFKLGLLAAVPSFALGLMATGVAQLVGFDPGSLLPKFPEPTLVILVFLIVLAPLIETLLLAFGLLILGRLLSGAWLVSVISGIGWGIIHGLQAPLWFFGTAWSFIVFSRAYLAWRPFGRANAIGAAWVPHIVQNAIGVGLFLVG